MKTILVPTDFSKNARVAIRYALGLAHHLKARIALYHVYQVPAPILEMTMVLLPDTEIRRLHEKQMQALVREVRKKAGPDIQVEGLVGLGSPVAKLADYIMENNMDLVVMGTKGANSVLDRLLGTNTADLMKRATCPVLAVPAKAKFQALSKIIFASDHTSQAAVFSAALLELAKKFAAEVVVVNVNTDIQANVGNEIEVPVLIRAHYPYDRYTFVSLVEKKKETAIEEFVRQTKPALLAVTIRKRGILESLFHRSVVKQLAFDLQVPMLALPEETILKMENEKEEEPERLADHIL